MIDRPDPYPRELIDVWPLHDARQELLEEIVSQPGPEQSPSPRRVLVPVGIAAALLLVVGGAWVAISAGGDPDPQDDASVAAPAEPTASDTTATGPSETAGTSEPADPDRTSRPERRDKDVRISGVEVGRVVTLQRCLRILRDSTGPRHDLKLHRMHEGKGRHLRFYLVRKDRRLYAVNEHCRVVDVRGRTRH